MHRVEPTYAADESYCPTCGDPLDRAVVDGLCVPCSFDFPQQIRQAGQAVAETVGALASRLFGRRR